MVIESIFGMKATLFAGLNAVPDFAAFDAKARLSGLRYQGGEYSVSAEGIKRLH